MRLVRSLTSEQDTDAPRLLVEEGGSRYLLKGEADHGEVLREYSAYQFAQQVSVVRVPDVSLVKYRWRGEPEPMVAVRVVPGAKPLLSPVQDQVPSVLAGLAASSVLRYTLGDLCFRGRNYLVDRDHELWMIDFGACFNPPSSYKSYAIQWGVFHAADAGKPMVREQVFEQVHRIESAGPHEWHGVPRQGVEAIKERVASLRSEVTAYWGTGG